MDDAHGSLRSADFLLLMFVVVLRRIPWIKIHEFVYQRLNSLFLFNFLLSFALFLVIPRVIIVLNEIWQRNESNFKLDSNEIDKLFMILRNF